MAKQKKRKPPSRFRYEENNPTVSCRVSKDIYDRLQKSKKVEGKSFAAILKIGLGLLEDKAEQKATIRKKALAEGHRKGYAEAENRFKVTYPCSICGRIIELTSEEAKKAVRKYMNDNRWGHSTCHNRRR